MIVYGINPVGEALEVSPETVQRVYLRRSRSSPRLQKLIDLCRKNRIPVHFEAARTLDRKTGGEKHQGVVAELTAHAYTELEEVLAKRPTLLVLLDGVEDPRNLGAVIRTAEAAGADALLLPRRGSCGITPSVIKTSAGAALHLKTCRIGNVADTLERLKTGGFWTVGLDISGKENMEAIDVELPLVLVIGSENRGLRRRVREKIDFLVRLPMRGKVGSLNLSAAAAVLIYRIMDRRSALRTSAPAQDSAKHRS